MKKITFLLAFLCVGISFGQSAGITIQINEIDVDQNATDTMEFIELLAQPNTSLDGHILVFFNGNNDQSYRTVDLAAVTTDTDGFAIIGGNMVPGADITLGASNVIQNGADAIAVYFANPADFPNGTPATATGVIDAVVYDTNDADDAGLLAIFGGIQINENENGMAETESLQRDSNGNFCTAIPTLRATNTECNTPCPLAIIVTSVTCDAITDGFDTYTTTLNFTGGGTNTYTLSSTEGTISGDNPSMVTNGQIIITNVTEGVDFDFMIMGGNCDILNTINAEICAPVSEVSSIAALRASTLDAFYTLTGEAFITFQQDFRNQKFIQDQTAAILIDDNPGVITTVYDIGDGISGITGFLTQFQGMLQFQVTEDPGPATTTETDFTPENVTVAQLTANPDDYESELVVLEIAFIDTSQNEVWVVGTEYPMIEDGSGDEYIFRTSFFDVNYIGEQVTSEVFITGIITERNDGNFFITARSSEDFNSLANVTQNSIEGFSLSPNPAKTTVSFSSLYMGTFDVTVFDVVGKEVLTAPAVHTLNVGSLPSGIYLVRVTQAGAVAVSKLVIK